MRYSNPGDPVYAPHSYGGPKADAPRGGAAGGLVDPGAQVRAAHTQNAEDHD